MPAKNWIHKPQPPEEYIARFPEQSRILSTLLFQRGLLKQEQVDEFLEPEYTHDLHDPFLFQDMEKAVDRILTALTEKERITIYGDYDADGVCGAAVLYCTLREFGAMPEVYIPYRMTEGYGMNREAIREIAKANGTLIITNDLGIMNADEVRYAKEQGIDVIVGDHHHEPQVLPEAYAILNPAMEQEPYPYKQLCGTGVSFKIACALLTRSGYAKDFRDTPLPYGWEKWLLDFVAIGTVADMVPLLGENRTLVHYGLDVLRKSPRKGLQALAKQMKTPLASATTQTIGFQIAPRLNAAGRLEHASTAFKLLVTDDQGEATRIAEALEQTNRERQRLTTDIVRKAKEQIGTPDRDAKIVFALGEGWPQGVVGIVAGKLVDLYGLPAIVAGKNGEIHGSGRSVPAFNIIEAVERVSAPLTKFGGHPQAFGFTAKTREDYDRFAAALSVEADRELAGKDIRPKLEIDMEIALPDADWDLMRDLEKLEPFGQENPQPLFLLRNLRLAEFRVVGNEGQHLQLLFRDGAVHRKAIAFRFGASAAHLSQGQRVDIVTEIGVNEWNGNQELQFIVRDIEPSA